LLSLAAKNKPDKRYKLFEWVKAWNTNHNTDIKVNVLPIAHPQLNPIELIWHQIKQYVSDNNHEYTMEGIRAHAVAAKAKIGATAWEKAYRHMRKFAETSWESDEAIADKGDEPDDEAVEEVETE